MQHEPANAPWRPGDRVMVRGAACTVIERTPFTDCETLRIASATNGDRTLLLPFDRPRAAAARTIRVVPVRRWLHRMHELLGETHPYGGLRACPAGIRLIPYQLEPAIAMLRDRHPRVLIADGVGLGKTIQAGLIVAELARASDTFRGLILTPAGLRHQWDAELVRHFGVRATAADAQWLRSALRELPADVNPWSLPGVYLASFDFVKRAEALRPLEGVRWDLLIVDEAHAATAGTDRRAAIDAIACRARRVVLLTATPHPGDPDQFEALCRIGAAREAALPVIFQRRRAPSADLPARRSTLLRIEPDATERRMHRLLEAYTTRVWQESRRCGRSGVHLASVVLRKRALSCPRSLAISVRRRLDLLAGAAPAPAQLLLPLGAAEDEAPLEDAVPDAALASPGLADPLEERRLLHDIAEAAAAAEGHEAKLRALLRLLARISEPIIVFTEYRDTLERLRASLGAAGRTASAIHGGMPPRERLDAVAAFNERGGTLLATDAASEGLNLQRSCRVVLQYELPWSPSRMEQRAGRVDRIGQTRRVHEIAFVGSDTAESFVLGPLVRRAAGWSGGEGLARRLTESRIAEAIIGGLPTREADAGAVKPAAVTVDCGEAATAEAARLLDLRRHAPAAHETRARDRHDAFVPVSLAPRRRNAPQDARRALRPGVALIYRLALFDGRAHIVHSEATVIHVACAPRAALRTAASIRNWTRAVPDHVQRAAAARAGEIGRARLDAIRPSHERALAAARQREHELSAVIPSAAQRLAQAGLFDRRAVKAAAERQRSAAAQRDAAKVEIGALVDAGRLTSSAELRAVLVIGGP